MNASGEITQMLAAVRRGETGAFDRVLPLVYDELRRIARRRLGRRTPGQTLETTALVNEAYLKLAHRPEADWRDRGHFLAVAAVAMRHILVDHARARAAEKRGGHLRRVPLDPERFGAASRIADILALDQALDGLARLDERLGRIVELRYFGGLSIAETAEVLGVSERTVKRDWRSARALLYRALRGPGAESDSG